MADKCCAGKDIGKIVVVFFAGSVAGALAGLLLAPRSGAETRQQIKKASTDAGDKAKEKFEEAKSGVVNLFSRGKEKVEDMKTEIQDKIQDAVEAGKDVYKNKKKEFNLEK
jgi:gas vesicle protein